MKVLVINQCSTNKGDRAVLYFLLRELKVAGINEAIVSASNPQYWLDKPDFPDINVRVIPWGWDVSRKKGAGLFSKIFHLLFKVKLPRAVYFPLMRNAFIAGKRPWYLRLFTNKQFLQAMQEADLVISTGGHHLTTIIAKSIRTPQFFDMVAVLMYKKPLLLWSQSVGMFEFNSDKDREMVQKIITGARQIYLRDDASESEIERLGISANSANKTYESVFGLYDIVKNRKQPSRREKIMGVSVWTGNKNNPQQWRHYIDCFAALISYAIKAGYKIRFFPMEMQGYDRPCIERIIEATDRKEDCEIIEGFPGTAEHINKIAECRVFAGHKTHSQIFSLVAATPLLAIAYHRKTEDFMSQFGLGDYCIVDQHISSDRLIEIFNKLAENLDVISLKQQETACKMAEKVKKDFAAMLESSQ